MITVTITAEVVGKAYLYEKLQQQGKRMLVPSYRAIATLDNSDTFEFAVTRDSSNIRYFGQTEKFGTYGECPPNQADEPYLARPGLLSSDRTYSLRLYDPELGDNAIKGAGEIIRTGIMIHRGPGRSIGCLQVAGGKSGHRRFERWFKPRIDADTKIIVEVLPYP